MKKTIVIALTLLLLLTTLVGCTGIKAQSYKRDVEKMGGLPITISDYSPSSKNGMISKFIAGSDVSGAYVCILEFREDSFAKKYFENEEIIKQFALKDGMVVLLESRFILMINQDAEKMLQNYRNSQKLF